MADITIFGEHEERTVEQLTRCAELADYAVLCADGHVGYSQPIGGAIAYRNHISPSGVGYDIGCGNKAVRTGLMAAEVPIADIMDEIARRISFGIGRVNDEPVDHPVLEAISQANFEPQRKLAQAAARQLGTVGAGNHYVDLFEDGVGFLWVGVHFGSRGFGHTTANGFLALSQGKEFDERGVEGEMDSPPVLFHADSDLGQAYIEAMTLAGDYAYAGRDVVVDKVLEILGTDYSIDIHNHHNYAWREEHFGEQYWVIRKGCTPAFPGQRGFVGATMGEASVILEGIESRESQGALYSTVHGAGRAMSRTKAAGKTRRRKYYECADRDCDYTHTDSTQSCPEHTDSRMIKRWRTEQIRPGLIDWSATLDGMRRKDIELRGGGADEAPLAYKRLPEVLAAHGDTIRVLHHLRPIGVAMAGPDTYDPYKD